MNDRGLGVAPPRPSGLPACFRPPEKRMPPGILDRSEQRHLPLPVPLPAVGFPDPNRTGFVRVVPVG